MKGKPVGEPQRRRSSWLPLCLSVCVVSPMIAMPIILLMLPIIAISEAISHFGETLGNALSQFFLDFLTLVSLVLLSTIGVIWSLLTGDWGPFIRILPKLLESLLSASWY
jgi:uncharacterized membrane protein